MKEKLKKLWVWLRKHVLNKEMFIYVLIAEVIFWSPCIVTGILGIVVSPEYWGIFGAYIAFWANPLTPAIILQLALAGLLKKIFGKKEK